MCITLTRHIKFTWIHVYYVDPVQKDHLSAQIKIKFSWHLPVTILLWAEKNFICLFYPSSFFLFFSSLQLFTQERGSATERPSSPSLLSWPRHRHCSHSLSTAAHFFFLFILVNCWRFVSWIWLIFGVLNFNFDFCKF